MKTHDDPPRPDQLPVPLKLLSLAQAVALRQELAEQGQRLVLTNGCFDVIHPGHLQFLRQARAQGEALWVLLNADVSVRALKGPHRPVVPEQGRAYQLDSLSCVDAVVLYAEARCTAELAALRPDIYVKAGDYRLETLDPGEREALTQAGAQVRFLPFLQGWSTTELLARLGRET